MREWVLAFLAESRLPIWIAIGVTCVVIEGLVSARDTRNRQNRLKNRLLNIFVGIAFNVAAILWSPAFNVLFQATRSSIGVGWINLQSLSETSVGMQLVVVVLYLFVYDFF